MPIDPSPSSRSSLQAFLNRAPLLLTTLAAVGGILFSDCAGPPTEILIGLAGLALLASAVWDHFQRPMLSAGFLLLTVFSTGGIYWNAQSLPRENDLRAFCSESGTPARLTGRVVSSPELKRANTEGLPGSPAAQNDQSRWEISDVILETDDGHIRCFGDCRVFVSGPVDHVRNGDIIRVVGALTWPAAPGNPGQFDYPRYLRHSGLHALLFVNTPAAVEVATPVPGFSVAGIRGRLRRESEQLIHDHISADMQPIAEALLLGHRGNLTHETQRDLIASGTMHLLAISGLHLGILFLVVFRCCRLLVMSHPSALVVALTCCIGYTLLTDVRPSMLRAVVFLTFFVLSQLFRRDVSIGTLLSLSVLLLIAIQPGSLFGVGTWLSMLSVVALSWAATLAGDVETQRPPDTPTLTAKLLWWPRAAWWHLRRDYIAMSAVILFNAPVVAGQFHVISPVGLAANILLIWPAAIVMTLGFLFLTSGLLLPAIGGLTGFAFDGALRLLIGTIDGVSDVYGGHLYVADPSLVFLIVYFVILTGVVAARPGWWRCGAAVVLATGLVLMSTSLTKVDGAHRFVRCSVLDVGHGSAALIESPDGRAVLVDCGAMNRGERAADILCEVLWHNGHRRLDAIVISHPDADHLNALRGILARVPTAQIIVTEHLLNSTEHSARFVVDEAAAADVPLLVVQRGDTIRLGHELSMTVLHPPPPTESQSVIEPDGQAASRKSARSDNEQSVTLLLESAGRRICLPGDLDGRGTSEVLQLLGPLDVLVSPHHGSRDANTRELVRVTRPYCVVASCGDTRNRKFLQAAYGPETRLFLTAEDGAVSVEISADGSIRGAAFRSKRGFELRPHVEN